MDKEISRQLKIQEIASAIGMAKVRSIPVSDLISQVSLLYKLDNREALLFRLGEIAPTHEEWCRLEGTVREMEASPEWREHKNLLIRIYRRLSYISPNAEEFGFALLLRSRKPLRELGYRLLKDSISADGLRRLLDLYGENQDQQYLTLVARNAAALEEERLKQVLHDLEDDYWRARAIQEHLDKRAFLDWAKIHFGKCTAWAIGRAKRRDLADVVRDVLQREIQDLDLVSLCIWAFGKMGLNDEIIQVESILFPRGAAGTLPGLMYSKISNVYLGEGATNGV